MALYVQDSLDSNKSHFIKTQSIIMENIGGTVIC